MNSPVTPKDVTFLCEHCSQSLVAATTLAGSSVACPACGKSIVIPTMQPASAHPHSTNTQTNVAIPPAPHSPAYTAFIDAMFRWSAETTRTIKAGQFTEDSLRDSVHDIDQLFSSLNVEHLSPSESAQLLPIILNFRQTKRHSDAAGICFVIKHSLHFDPDLKFCTEVVEIENSIKGQLAKSMLEYLAATVIPWLEKLATQLRRE